MIHFIDNYHQYQESENNSTEYQPQDYLYVLVHSIELQELMLIENDDILYIIAEINDHFISQPYHLKQMMNIIKLDFQFLLAKNNVYNIKFVIKAFKGSILIRSKTIGIIVLDSQKIHFLSTILFEQFLQGEFQFSSQTNFQFVVVDTSIKQYSRYLKIVDARQPPAFFIPQQLMELQHIITQDIILVNPTVIRRPMFQALKQVTIEDFAISFQQIDRQTSLLETVIFTINEQYKAHHPLFQKDTEMFMVIYVYDGIQILGNVHFLPLSTIPRLDSKLDQKFQLYNTKLPLKLVTIANSVICFGLVLRVILDERPEDFLLSANEICYFQTQKLYLLNKTLPGLQNLNGCIIQKFKCSVDLILYSQDTQIPVNTVGIITSQLTTIQAIGYQEFIEEQVFERRKLKTVVKKYQVENIVDYTKISQSFPLNYLSYIKFKVTIQSTLLSKQFDYINISVLLPSQCTQNTKYQIESDGSSLCEIDSIFGLPILNIQVVNKEEEILGQNSIILLNSQEMKQFSHYYIDTFENQSKIHKALLKNGSFKLDLYNSKLQISCQGQYNDISILLQVLETKYLQQSQIQKPIRFPIISIPLFKEQERKLHGSLIGAKYNARGLHAIICNLRDKFKPFYNTIRERMLTQQTNNYVIIPLQIVDQQSISIKLKNICQLKEYQVQKTKLKFLAPNISLIRFYGLQMFVNQLDNDYTYNFNTINLTYDQTYNIAKLYHVQLVFALIYNKEDIGRLIINIKLIDRCTIIKLQRYQTHHRLPKKLSGPYNLVYKICVNTNLIYQLSPDYNGLLANRINYLIDVPEAQKYKCIVNGDERQHLIEHKFLIMSNKQEAPYSPFYKVPYAVFYLQLSFRNLMVVQQLKNILNLQLFYENVLFKELQIQLHSCQEQTQKLQMGCTFKNQLYLQPGMYQLLIENQLIMLSVTLLTPQWKYAIKVNANKRAQQLIKQLINVQPWFNIASSCPSIMIEQEGRQVRVITFPIDLPVGTKFYVYVGFQLYNDGIYQYGYLDVEII